MRLKELRRAALGLITAVLLVLATVGFLRRDEAVGAASEAYWFGTLQTESEEARAEYKNGLRVAHLQIDWDRFEPEQDVFDEAYVDEIKDRIESFHDAGLRIEAGLGLHHPPDWLAKAYPWAVYVNQFGEHSAWTPNIVFSHSVRFEAEQYLTEVKHRIGLEDFWALRIGVNESGEFSYPTPVSQEREQGEYWAFDDNAQSTSPDTDRPVSVAQNPYPGWRPGDRTYRGEAFTEQQARAWYDWYLASLADAVNWQIGVYTALGHTGQLKVLIPGTGHLPADQQAAVAARLGATDSARLVGRGVAFFETIGMIQHQSNVVLVSTALVDGTGKPRDNECRPGDAAVDVRAPDERTVRDWSSTRWVTAVARAEGFDRLSGESAGPQVAAYHPGVMDTAARQMASCGLEGLMWAFDQNLYDGTPGSSLADYAAMIRRHG
ncbi:beta-galactosidase [Streptomyces sp. Je 1-79]|uniref:beta-galactosidase n=1 Tax=Streptomyces sp. Je 1-79 TaxID=2943847 RepID=UPI0021A2E1C1|nr:beta-galactosidase [Streptomyces sp. Je 1-79]MCT4354019.1 beta-galactosidase [Streptomyces sp. Je 1-79]